MALLSTLAVVAIGRGSVEGSESLGAVLEKIAVEDGAEAGKQIGINTPFFEDFVHIGSVTVEFAGQPGDGAFLTVELFLDELTNVYHRNQNEGCESVSRMSLQIDII